MDNTIAGVMGLSLSPSPVDSFASVPIGADKPDLPDYVHAYIKYEEVVSQPEHPWFVQIEYYNQIGAHSYSPSLIRHGRFEWLGDAMTALTNLVRMGQYSEVRIDIFPEGQPPLQHCAEHGR